MSQTLKEKATKGIRWSFLNTALTVLFQSAQIVILGRLLNPVDFGLMGLLLVLTEFFMIILPLGLSDAIIAGQKQTQTQLSSLFVLNICTGILLFAVILCTSPFIAALLKENQLAPMIPVISVVFLIAAPTLQFEARLRKELQFDTLTTINIVSTITKFAVAVFLALNDYGVWSLVYGHIASFSSRTLFLLLTALNKKWFYRPEFNFSEIKSYLSFGIHRTIAMAINQINTRMDQLIIGTMLGPVFLGYYTMAYGIVFQPVQQINSIITKVAFPVFSIIQEDRSRLKSAYLKMLRIIFAANAPMLIGISVIAPIAVPLILGNKWKPSVPVIQLLSFYALLRIPGNTGGALILSKGKANWSLYWNLCLMMFIPATVFLTAWFSHSVTIVAAALVCIQLSLLFFHYYFLLRPLLNPFLTEYASTLFRPVVLSGVMAMIILITIRCISPFAGGYLLLAGLIFEGITIYVLISFMFQKIIFLELYDILPKAIQTQFKLFFNIFCMKRINR